MIDLASSDNLLLRINPEMGFANNEVLISVSYSAMKGIFIESIFSMITQSFFLGIIAAGTNRGNIAFWVYTPNRRTTDMEKHWNLQRIKTICTGIAIRSLKVKYSYLFFTVICSFIFSIVHNEIVLLLI